ncbi:hypothetical protein EPO44_14480 [bacterium]|nr:MAG: hypothetical protein EPO44_14480 [bacterium]
MAFYIESLIALVFGRYFGWWMCRKFLYSSGWTVCVIVCVIWGVGLAYGTRLFILDNNPNLWMKIWAYGTGMYISIPNYGLFDESTVADDALSRHVFIKGVPWILFMLASIVFAFTISH